MTDAGRGSRDAWSDDASADRHRPERATQAPHTTVAPAPTTNEARVREVFRRLFDERDLSDPYASWSDDSVDHVLAAGQSVRGASALAVWFGGLFVSVPDWGLVVDNFVDRSSSTSSSSGREPGRSLTRVRRRVRR